MRTAVEDEANNKDFETARPLVFRGERWRIRAGWEAVLFNTGGFWLDQWLAGGAATVVRTLGRRTVYRVETDASGGRPGQGRGTRRFFVKQIRCRGPFDALKNLLRGSAAEREWNNALEALRRGLPTAVPIAWGERIRGRFARDSYFISEEIADAVALDRFAADMSESLPREARASRRRALIESLARFVASLHETGLFHGDFHAGNILVQDEQGRAGGPRLFLIDIAAARFGSPLSWSASRKNLVVLNAEWADRSTPRERLRFWKTYLRERQKTPADEQPVARTPSAFVPRIRDFARQMDVAAREYSRRIDRSRDRRAMRTNRDFYALKRPAAGAGQGGATWLAHAVADLPRGELEKLLDKPDELLLENLHRPIKLGHSSLMVKAVIELADGPHEVCYKRCRAKNRWKTFCNRFRSGRAVRAWRLGHAFLSRGIATPRPIMVCRQRLSPTAQLWPSRPEYLAVQWIEGAVNLHLWAWSLAGLPRDERMRRAARCAASIGRLVGRMHARQISHGDLKGGNVLIADGGEKEFPPQVFLIDLDAARIHKRLPRRRQVADLARLATSLAAHSWADSSLWRRFWRAYEREFPRGVSNRKSLWRAVAERRKKLLAKKQNRGEAVL